MRQYKKLASVTALVLAAPVLLTGCAEEDSAPKGSEAVVEDLNATPNGETSKPSDGAKSEAKNDADTPDITEIAEGELPKGWPSEAIVPKGDISYSGKVDDAFSVIMVAEDTAIDDAIDAMKSKGWKENLNMGADDGRIISLQNADWTISMIVGKDEKSGKMSIIYTVTPV